ncbi:hypothetical protein [Sphingobacterium bovistauri]|uniref:Tetratricopeptide repeat-containing protein n=1 Tax=Sphingobacterium bovistauri TaxID=2781959 RepID=A0ABS7Z593_9SPHI|nr:hypothetical protein [Sphingobacterium bovistauri]MCA5003914.1 hypothetical protein [Sphingobacterium bovistauri]
MGYYYTHIFVFLFLLLSSCNQPNYKKEAIELNNKGSQFFLQNKKDSALIYFTLATEKNPQYQIAIQNKVNALISLQQYEQALVAIADLLRIQAYAEIFTIKGMLLDKLNKSDEANKAYKEGIKKFEDRIVHTSEAEKSMIMLKISELYFLMGDTTKAKTILLEDKIKAQNLGTVDSILKNLNNKARYIDVILNKVS